MADLLRFAPSAAVYIFALAAQVSGYTNLHVAFWLIVAATVLLLLGLSRRLPNRLENRSQPMGIAWAFFSFALIAGGIWAAYLSYTSFWPIGSRNRSRPSLRIHLRWANSISTRLRSRLDCSKADVS